MNEYKNALKFGAWKLQAINNIPDTVPAEILGYAIKKINSASLNNDGTISICPVHTTRKEAEAHGYNVAHAAVYGVKWKE